MKSVRYIPHVKYQEKREQSIERKGKIHYKYWIGRENNMNNNRITEEKRSTKEERIFYYLTKIKMPIMTANLEESIFLERLCFFLNTL